MHVNRVGYFDLPTSARNEAAVPSPYARCALKSCHSVCRSYSQIGLYTPPPGRITDDMPHTNEANGTPARMRGRGAEPATIPEKPPPPTPTHQCLLLSASSPHTG